MNLAPNCLHPVEVEMFWAPLINKAVKNDVCIIDSLVAIPTSCQPFRSLLGNLLLSVELHQSEPWCCDPPRHLFVAHCPENRHRMDLKLSSPITLMILTALNCYAHHNLCHPLPCYSLADRTYHQRRPPYCPAADSEAFCPPK